MQFGDMMKAEDVQVVERLGADRDDWRNLGLGSFHSVRVESFQSGELLRIYTREPRRHPRQHVEFAPSANMAYIRIRGRKMVIWGGGKRSQVTNARENALLPRAYIPLDILIRIPISSTQSFK